jgi:hypothetical protein
LRASIITIGEGAEVLALIEEAQGGCAGYDKLARNFLPDCSWPPLSFAVEREIVLAAIPAQLKASRSSAAQLEWRHLG